MTKQEPGDVELFYFILFLIFDAIDFNWSN